MFHIALVALLLNALCPLAFASSPTTERLVTHSVTRTDTTPAQPVVTYTYGTSGLINGQVTEVVDNLSGETQDFTYASSGAGLGQVSAITETDASSNSYSTSYTYNDEGSRQVATYTTPNGTVKWGYYDYQTVGDPTGPSRVFQTLNKLDSSGDPTDEEFHYAYMSSGALKMAAFAQTPQSGQDYSVPADHRAIALYRYDAGGRLTQLDYGWQNWASTAYSTPEAIFRNSSTYEMSGSNRGLKLTNKFYTQDSSDPTAYGSTPEHQEDYAYDADLDYLTQARYDDDGNGTWDTTPTWTYDAAGNRNDASTVDNLNRMTGDSSSNTYENDILGNRTWRNRYVSTGAVRMTWDALNRMVSCCNSTSGARYV